MYSRTHFSSVCRCIISLTFLSGWAVLSGCVAVQSFPAKARAGDTVMLAVGSPDKMTRANTQAVFTYDSSGTQVDLTPNIRSIFKIYPDRTSKEWLFPSQGGSFTVNDVQSYSSHGPWQTIVAIDLPSTMATGNGKVSFNTSGVIYPLYASKITQNPVTLRIMAGQGSPDLFKYKPADIGSTIDGNLPGLEPSSQIVVRPPTPTVPGGSDNNVYGAIEFNLNVPMTLADPDQTIEDNIRIVPDDMGSIMFTEQIQTLWSRSGDVIKVRFLSPVGMYSGQVRFSLAYNPAMITLQSTSNFLSGVTFYDLNGAPITGPNFTAALEI